MKDVKEIFDKIESVIIVLSIIGVIFLVIQLGFITDIEMPVYYDEYEEVREDNFVKNKEVGYIIIKKNYNGFDGLVVTINGKGKHRFDKKNELKLKVYDGDTIGIDSTMYNEEIEIMVVGISKNIKEPRLNEKIIIKESIKTFPEVKIN